MEIIRRYKKQDFEQVAELHFEMAKLEQEWLGLNPKMINIGNVKAFFGDELREKDFIAYVCELDRNVAGFITGRMKEKEDFEFYKIKKYFYIDDLYVNPKFRGRGIATKLMAEMEKHAKRIKAKEIVMNVSEKNKCVLSLYFKEGYNITEYQLLKEI